MRKARDADLGHRPRAGAVTNQPGLPGDTLLIPGIPPFRPTDPKPKYGVRTMPLIIRLREFVQPRMATPTGMALN